MVIRRRWLEVTPTYGPANVALVPAPPATGGLSAACVCVCACACVCVCVRVCEVTRRPKTVSLSLSLSLCPRPAGPPPPPPPGEMVPKEPDWAASPSPSPPLLLGRRQGPTCHLTLTGMQLYSVYVYRNEYSAPDLSLSLSLSLSPSPLPRPRHTSYKL